MTVVARRADRARRWLTACWRWPANWGRGWARGVATVSGILATGFAGLVIEDLFPNDPNLSRIDFGHGTWFRVGLLAVTSLVFGWVFWSGAWRDRIQGTLIYAVFLSRGHIDRHSESAETSGRDRILFRSLFRRCPTPAGLSADVTEQVEEFADRLSELIHADDPSTRTTIAPNMLMPVGLAMGWRLTAPADLHLLEVDTRVDMSLSDLEKAWATAYSVTTSSVWDSAAAPSGGPAPARPTSGPIWLDIYLSNKEYPRRAAIGTGFPTPADRRIIGVPKPGEPNTFAIVNAGGSDPAAFDPAELAVLIARAIQEEVVKQRPVILTGQMPKIVTVAVGWLLWRHRGDVRDAQNRPLAIWRHLVPLVWSDPDQAFRFLRVGYDQPTAAGLGIGAQ